MTDLFENKTDSLSKKIDFALILKVTNANRQWRPLKWQPSTC